MKKDTFIGLLVLLSILMLGYAESQAEIVDLITNGDFSSLSLDGWRQIDPDPASSIEWGIASGNAGAEPIHAADNSAFATPWKKGPNPSSTTIGQKIDLSPYLGSIQGNTLHLNADLIYSRDSIEANAKFYNSSDEEISTIFLTSKRASSPGGYNYALDTDLSIPANATSVEILFTGHLYVGSYIDAGFDDVSLTADIVPEPMTAMLLLAGAGILARRKQ